MAERAEGFIQGQLAKRFSRLYVPSVPSIQVVRWTDTNTTGQHQLHFVEKTNFLGIEMWHLQGCFPINENNVGETKTKLLFVNLASRSWQFRFHVLPFLKMRACNLEHIRLKGCWGSLDKRGVVDVQIGVRHFTNPGNDEHRSVSIFVKSKS